MRWEIQIEGPRAILRQLALAVSGSDIRLMRRDEHFILSGSLLDSCVDVETVRCEADRIVTLLSGSARLSLGCPESLRVGDVTEACEKSTCREPIEVARGAPWTWRHDARTSIDARSERDAWPQRSSLSKSLREALSNPAMAKALELRNAANLNWVQLVRIYDVIEKATGGRPAVTSFSGVTEITIERLHQTAKSVAGAEDVDGDDRGTQPTVTPMTLTEARNFVDRLLMAWFASVTLSRTRHLEQAAGKNRQQLASAPVG